MTAKKVPLKLNDSGGLVHHKDYCPHVDDIFGDALLSSDSSSAFVSFLPDLSLASNAICQSPECECAECWMCFQCKAILCGRYGAQHMVRHFEQNASHCIVLGINDLSFWCYACSDYINHLTLRKVYTVYDLVHQNKFGTKLPQGLLRETKFRDQDSNQNNNNIQLLLITEETEDGMHENENENENENEHENKNANEELKQEVENEEPQTQTDASGKESKVAKKQSGDGNGDESGNESPALNVVDSLLQGFSKLFVSAKQLTKPTTTTTTTTTAKTFKRTQLVYHSDCLKHKSPRSHVECPERCSTSLEFLKQYQLLKNCQFVECRECTAEELSLTHSESHISRILQETVDSADADADTATKSPQKKTKKKQKKQKKQKKTNGWYDSDTYFNEYSARASKLAAGGTIQLLQDIMAGECDNGFALVRPPGHHCEHEKPMGFCLFNNAVVAVNAVLADTAAEEVDEEPNAENANANANDNGNDNNHDADANDVPQPQPQQEQKKKKEPRKVLIVDWDIHHGNGTQNMFYSSDNVLYFSIHRYDNNSFYPFSGHLHEIGDESVIASLGKNINVPLNVVDDDGYGDKEYLYVWQEILLPVAREFSPDLILISAGFDACIGDYLGGMRVTPPGYGILTRLLLNVCPNVAILLEGGYNLETMPRAICCCVYSLLMGACTANTDDPMAFEREFSEFLNGGQSNGNDNTNANNNSNDDAVSTRFNEWRVTYAKQLSDTDYASYLAFLAKKLGKENDEAFMKQDLTNFGQCVKMVGNLKKELQLFWKCFAEIRSD